MVRISKEPEVRRQEILNVALKVFYEKGYDGTKMSDIADRVGIAQGLCYRYFPSKEALFDCAVEQYAKLQADQMKPVFMDSSLSLKEKLDKMPGFMEVESDKSTYYHAFHNENSRKIHDQLSLKICEMMVPPVAEAIKQAHDRGEVKIEDHKTAATFGVYGQLGILLDDSMDGAEKIKKIRSFLDIMLNQMSL